ncbi:Arm DNA-binding domain-containing protein [Alkalibacillus aidingensis]|nr:Arm DNA-binding domain-containing protein [Alkalibacillus aidingensis]
MIKILKRGNSWQFSVISIQNGRKRIYRKRGFRTAYEAKDAAEKFIKDKV